MGPTAPFSQHHQPAYFLMVPIHILIPKIFQVGHHLSFRVWIAAKEASVYSILKFTGSITDLSLHTASQKLEETDHTLLSDLFQLRATQTRKEKLATSTHTHCGDPAPF